MFVTPPDAVPPPNPRSDGTLPLEPTPDGAASTETPGGWEPTSPAHASQPPASPAAVQSAGSRSTLRSRSVGVMTRHQGDPGAAAPPPEPLAASETRRLAELSRTVRGRGRRASADEGRSLSVEAAEQRLADTDAEAFYRSVAALARPSQTSVLQSLTYSPNLPGHLPRSVRIEPEPGTIELVRLYGHAAYPEFEEQFVARFADPARADLLEHLFDLLVCEGGNLALVTNHGDITDIAVVLGALLVAMCDEDRTFGVLGERLSVAEMADRSNILVSRMVASRQAFGVPALSVLASYCRTFLSVPQTQSRRKARLDPELARANNVVMRARLDEQLAKGGQLVAMAASGSQDLSVAAHVAQRVRASWRARRGEDPGDHPSLHLQPLYNGTIDLMVRCRHVLPLAISLNQDHPAVVLGSVTRVSGADDCHRVMEWIARSHEAATGVATVYHAHEDDLLTQVRDALRS